MYGAYPSLKNQRYSMITDFFTTVFLIAIR